MDINRDNYEEYFLLYADDELTDSEKAEVLMFLKENKDFEEEFRMIHYTICKPEADIELADKSFLLKGSEASFINKKNYEEVFVLYHDNELAAKQREQTENFLILHTQLKNEFDLIGMAKLTPEDAVIFPNKRKLYKKEKTGKVIPIFWRALVAAVFIGSGLWMVQVYVQKENKKPAVTVHSNPPNQTIPVIEKKTSAENKTNNNTVQSPGGNRQHLQTEIPREKVKIQKTLPQKNMRMLSRTSEKSQKGLENLSKQAPEKTNNEEKINNETVSVADIKNIPKDQIAENNDMEPAKELAQVVIQTDEKAELLPYAQNTSYLPDVPDNGENYVFYDITTEEFKKTKVSSFLKKVKRVIERNNPIIRLLSGNEKQVVSN